MRTSLSADMFLDMMCLNLFQHVYVPPQTVMIPTVIFGMFVTFLCGYGPTPLPFPWSLAEDVSLVVFRSREVVRYVFWSAVAVHVVEGGFAGKEARRLGMGVGLTLTWMASVVLFGCKRMKDGE